jgi:hypothetical protein
VTRRLAVLSADQYTFMNISRSVLLRLRYVSEKKYILKINKHTFYFQKFSSVNCAVREIMWKNIVEQGRLMMTIYKLYGAEKMLATCMPGK